MDLSDDEIRLILEELSELEAENEKLKKRADYWETKAGEYKALMENMERGSENDK